MESIPSHPHSGMFKRISICFIVTAWSILTVHMFAQEYTLFDSFEKEIAWVSKNWGDSAEVEKSQLWQTSGNYSLKFHNTTASSYNAVFESSDGGEESPELIVLDIKNDCGHSYKLKVEVVDNNENARLIGEIDLSPETVYTNVTFSNSGNFRKVRIVPDNILNKYVTFFVDNIRFIKNGQTVVWDDCELSQNHSWTGFADAITDSSGIYSKTVYSPNQGSTASIIVQWNATVASWSTNAELKTTGLNVNLSDYVFYEFEVFRPSSTGNAEIKIFTTNGTEGVLTPGVRADTADQWTKVQISVFGTNSALTGVQELNIVIAGTDTYTTGKMYFDNFRLVKATQPQSTILNLNTFGNPHVLIDYTEGLYINNYFGNVLYGSAETATINQSISASDYYTSPALKIDFDVTSLGTDVYHVNTMAFKYEGTNKIALYLKGGSNNPGIVKLELHDKNWYTTYKGAICYLGGISSVSWKQWILDLDTTAFESDGNFDFNNITGVAIVIENSTAREEAGTLYVDDVTFVDSTDILIPYDGFRPETDPDDLIGSNWDNPSLWEAYHPADGSSNTLVSFPGLNDDGFIVDYTLGTQGWVNINRNVTFNTSTNPLVFFLKSNSSSDGMQIKFFDTDSSVFVRTFGLGDKKWNNEWWRMVIYLRDLSYAPGYGGNSTFDTLSKIELAITGEGSGRVWLDEIGVGPSTLISTFGPVWDPDSVLTGIGDAQRRAVSMAPEDPLVLEFLKQLQDISGTAHTLIISEEGSGSAQTFNNSMAAMAFILKGEKERAERILDFYSSATDINNSDIYKQNFFFNDTARGFYQECDIITRQAIGSGDRWMGDMAWLLCAYKFYERQYSSNKYATITGYLRDFLRSLYKPASFANAYNPDLDYTGGYLLKGWRNFDTYSPTDPDDEEGNGKGIEGHHEGNIDAYAALKLCGIGADTLNNIKVWVENELTTKHQNKDLPLDLYTWRTMAFGADTPGMAELLNIPEYDFRYRKTLNMFNTAITGFYAFPDFWTDNFWSDGFGHIVCAYLSYGDRQRGYYYGTQLDKMLITREIGGVTTKSLPYTANKSGEFSTIDTTIGYTSTSAWYIFAKNSFNPFSAYSIYLDVPYTQRENDNYSGAACVKMVLDYSGTNSYTQTTLQNYGIQQNYTTNIGQDFLDPYGMYRTINYYELDPDYNYAQLTRTSLADAYKDLCYWISNDISNVQKIHMPSAVPVGAGFNSWVIINGFQASGNPHLQSAYTVYGFYIKDPRVNGIGQDMYVQASSFGDSYFLPIVSSDIWNGKYVSINEPPANSTSIAIQALQPYEATGTNEARYQAAEEGLRLYQLMNDQRISNAMNGAVRGRIYLVDVNSTEDDYCIVCFEKGGGVVAAVIIKESDGALKEVSFLDTPDENYYSVLDSLSNTTRLCKSTIIQKFWNSFYPETASEITSIGAVSSKSSFTSQQSSMNRLEIWPNPVTDLLSIHFTIDQKDKYRITICDISGRILKTIINSDFPPGSHTMEVDVQDLAKGIYFCKLSSGNVLSTNKFIIR